MVYIALLRGINVGGKNKIDMKLLKKAFEQAGMEQVVTYINTGNIIFTCEALSQEQLAPVLEEAIQTHFGFHIHVLVRSLPEIHLIMEALPASWTNDDAMKSDVLFVWDDIQDDTLLAKLPVKPELETVILVPGAVLWSVDRANVTRSGMSKLAGNKLYQRMTVRNVNTARKIYELMLEVDSARDA